MSSVKERLGCVAACVLIGAFWSSGMWAAAQPTLDELLGITADGGAETGQGPAAVEDESALELDGQVARQLHGVEAAELLGRALAEMGDVAQRLEDRGDVGLRTQRLQQSILARLDQVIAAAIRSASGDGRSVRGPGPADSGSEGNIGRIELPGRGAGGSSGAGEHGGQFSPGSVGRSVEDQPLEQTDAQWGQLPRRLQRQLQEGMAEPMSAVYKDLTEAYYRRLAEQEY